MIEIAVSKQPFRQKNEWRLLNFRESIAESANNFSLGLQGNFDNLSVNGYDTLKMIFTSSNPDWENWRFAFRTNLGAPFFVTNVQKFISVRQDNPSYGMFMSVGELGSLVQTNIGGNPVADRSFYIWGIPSHNRRI
jgi:hypothetical protein